MEQKLKGVIKGFKYSFVLVSFGTFIYTLEGNSGNNF